MTGSYRHCCKEDGSWVGDDAFSGMIENLGDAHEACQMMHWMISHLAAGDVALIEAAEESYWVHVRGEA